MLAAVIEDRRLVWSNDPDKNLARCSEIKADYVSADKIVKANKSPCVFFRSLLIFVV